MEADHADRACPGRGRTFMAAGLGPRCDKEGQTSDPAQTTKRRLSDRQRPEQPPQEGQESHRVVAIADRNGKKQSTLG